MFLKLISKRKKLSIYFVNISKFQVLIQSAQINIHIFTELTKIQHYINNKVVKKEQNFVRIPSNRQHNRLS